MPTSRIYRRLCLQDRDIIYRMSKDNEPQRTIALALGVSQSTISPELTRNRSIRGYRPKHAEQKATYRQSRKARRALLIQGELSVQVEQLLRLKYSPEQISMELSSNGIGISHESIYKHIRQDKQTGGSLYKFLRINGKRLYRKRLKTKCNKIPNRIGIEQRPSIVCKRLRYGDWEADLIQEASKSGYVLSLYERKSRFLKLLKLKSKDSALVAAAIIKQLKGYKAHTLIFDNGIEFAQHDSFARQLKAKTFFCEPYCSWQKGGIENANGIVRQYLPRGSSFENLNPDELLSIQTLINQKTRKIISGNSPLSIQNKIAA